MLVGSAVRVRSLVWPKDPRCKCLVEFSSLSMLVGSTVKVWSLVWPKDPQCRCLVWFREFVGACGCLWALQ